MLLVSHNISHMTADKIMNMMVLVYGVFTYLKGSLMYIWRDTIRQALAIISYMKPWLRLTIQGSDSPEQNTPPISSHQGPVCAVS